MACRRCSICSRNFATSVYVCPGCGEKTWFLKNDNPDEEAPVGDGERRNALTQGRVVSSNKVIDWRFEVLEKAGFSNAQALTLSARADVDLHLAVDLIARGCDPDTAFDILS